MRGRHRVIKCPPLSDSVFGCRFQAGNSSSGPDDDDGPARAPARASAAFERLPALVERKRVGDFHVHPAAIDERSEFGKLVTVGCDK